MKRRKRWQAAVLCALCWTCAFSTLRAQDGRQVRGTVRDETGGALVGASVVIDDANGHRYTTPTDDRGQYNIAAVPGTYTLAVTLEGFSPFSQRLDLAARSRVVDVKLNVALNEQVEVTSVTVPDLFSIRISGKALKALPEDRRQLLRSLRRMAGLDGNPNEVQVYVNGEAGGVPPKAAIEMITINLDAFAAQYAEPGQTRIEIVTKPAVGSFGGGGSFDFNNQLLNARNAFAPVRAPVVAKGYEANVGGPIVPGLWGFSISAGRPEEDQNATINATALNPVTLTPEAVRSVVTTRNRGDNVALNTSFRAAQTNTANISYSHSRSDSTNQGLDGGLDLPERAFSARSVDNGMRASATSVVNASLLNEVHFGIGRHESDTQAISSRPAVIVLNSFQAGGNQDALWSLASTDWLQVSDVITHTAAKHSMRVGLAVNRAGLNSEDRSGFGGSFIFGTDFERDATGAVVRDGNGQASTISPLELYRRTLLGLPGYRPSQFSIVAGDPAVRLTQWTGAGFAQDDWHVASRLSVSYGVRYEFQSDLTSRRNVAPRVGLAWSVNEKRGATLRAGAGLFYARVAPGITLDALRFDGRREQQLLIDRPPFFDVVPATFTDVGIVQPTIHVKSPVLDAPQSLTARVTYQQKLIGPLRGSIRYGLERGNQLLRTRNLNAPDASMRRPFPDAGPIWQVESTGRSLRHELRLAFNADVTDGFSFYGSYTRASARSDTDQAGTLPADSNFLADEFGRARSDRHHRFYLEGSLTLPHGIELSPNITIASGAPFNITTGADNNGDGTFMDRPAFASRDSANAIVTPFGVFNPNPRPGDVIIPRNFGQGAGELTVNLDVSKTLGFGPRRADGHHRFHMSLNAEALNLTNRTNLTGFNGVVTAPLFGLANRARDERKVKLSMNVNF